MFWLALANFNAIIHNGFRAVKKQPAAGRKIVPAAIGYFLFGFLGNHPRSTRRACSFSSRILQRQATPKSPRTMEERPRIKRAATRQSSPAIKNAGQTRCVKWYSHQITRGWNAPMINKDAAPTIMPSIFRSTGITSKLSYHVCNKKES